MSALKKYHSKPNIEQLKKVFFTKCARIAAEKAKERRAKNVSIGST